MPTPTNLFNGRQLELLPDVGTCELPAEALICPTGIVRRAAKPAHGAGPSIHRRDRITVDLRGLRFRIERRAVQHQSTTAALVRRAVMLMLDDGSTRTKPPSEHETVAYLVLPLLRSLGWTPQRMGVEWHHIDVALFDRLPRADANLCVVVEAKRMNVIVRPAPSLQRDAAPDTIDLMECTRLEVCTKRDGGFHEGSSKRVGAGASAS